MIRLATPDDIPAIKRIADANRRELGFVMRPALEESQARGELLVAELDGAVVGFVNYRTLSRVRVGWHTVYEICVTQDHRGKGIGGALLDAVPRPLRLKCPTDLASNAFYRAYGLINVWTEQPEGKRALNVWQTQPDLIFCAGNNKAEAEVARDAGMLYGIRHDCKPYWHPYFIDINWKRYDWKNYLELIRKTRPIMAMVNDYEHADQRETMLIRVSELLDCGVERVMVCPKFPDAWLDIPEQCVIAVSVPSQYAGYPIPHTAVSGRRVHLLGGVPREQFDQFRKFTGAGAIVSSVDGNAFLGTAQRGTFYEAGKWRNLGYRRVSNQDAFATSAHNIVKQWRQHGSAAQLPLF